MLDLKGHPWVKVRQQACLISDRALELTLSNETILILAQAIPRVPRVRPFVEGEISNTPYTWKTYVHPHRARVTTLAPSRKQQLMLQEYSRHTVGPLRVDSSYSAGTK